MREGRLKFARFVTAFHSVSRLGRVVVGARLRGIAKRSVRANAMARPRRVLERKKAAPEPSGSQGRPHKRPKGPYASSASIMEWAAFLPAPMARMTVAAPVTMSPPAQMRGSDVRPFSSASM